MNTLTKNQMARWCRLDLAVPGTVAIENEKGKVKMSLPVIFKPYVGPGSLGVVPEGVPVEGPTFIVKKCGRYYLAQRDSEGELINERTYLGWFSPGAKITIGEPWRPSWMTNP